MKITPAPLRVASAATLLTVALAGCASTSGSNHPMAGAPMGMQGQQGMPKDMQAMCDMHKQQMAGKSSQERQAMMDEHMRSMSREMRSRMQSMMEQCR